MFFTSLLVIVILTTPSSYHGIDACGTALLIEGVSPKELTTKPTKHNRAFMDYFTNGPLLASVWVNKHTIYFLSTMHVAEPPTATACTVKNTLIQVS